MRQFSWSSRKFNKFRVHLLRQILSKLGKKNTENTEKFSFTPLDVKHVFHCTNFHETHKRSTTTLCEDLLYRISPKSVNKSGNYGYKFIYSLRWPSSSRFLQNSVFVDFFFLVNNSESSGISCRVKLWIYFDVSKRHDAIIFLGYWSDMEMCQHTSSSPPLD